MSQKFFAILTASGEAKLANATALGTTVRIAKMAVGDGNGAQTVPDRAQTTLKRETRRAPVNRVFVDPANPAQIVAEQVIPESEGGWWIREIGLFDDSGVMIAVANCPDSYKPVLAEGSGRTQVIRVVLVVSSTDVVELRVDPSVVLATRGYAESLVVEHEAEANPHPQYNIRLRAGEPLPAQDIGPIWHDDYNSWMTWQVFNANGAAYAGYASVLVGGLLLDTQPTPRKGYVRSGVQNLNRTTYAALRGWAMHNGIMVAQGVWAAGTIAVCDNADGATFRAYDVRGEFFRAWDDGRGVDASRAFGSAQGDAIRNITGEFAGGNSLTKATASPSQNGAIAAGEVIENENSLQRYPLTAFSVVRGFSFDASRVVPTATENRSRNTAQLASIKF